MGVKCPESFQQCESGKEWHLTINVIAILYLLLQIPASSWLLLHFTKKFKNPSTQQQPAICGAVIALSTLRVAWWSMNVYKYRDNTPMAIVVQVFNRLSFLALFLLLSFYIQSYIKLLAKDQYVKYMKKVKIAFITIDLAITLYIVIEIIIRCSDGEEYAEESKYHEVLYWIGIYIMSSLTLLLAVVFLVVGVVLIFRFKYTFGCCSPSTANFWLLSTVFCVASLSRFICYIWSDLVDGMMEQNCFAIFCYLLPDTLSCIFITFNQVKLFQVQKNQITNEMTPGYVNQLV